MSLVVDFWRQPELHSFITNRNLLWQYEFLQQSIMLSFAGNGAAHLGLSGPFVQSLNHFAVVNLSPTPGELRWEEVHIEGSPYTPPHPDSVKDHFHNFIVECNSKWQAWDAVELCAYVMWRLNWIHPFEEGNGRTARAAAYFVLCRRLGFLLPGKNMIPQQIKEAPGEYYKGLRHADENMVDERADLGPLKNYISEMLKIQLRSGGVMPDVK